MFLHFAQEIRWSAAHYIPEHDKCGGIHGHTYFLRDLAIDITNVELQENGISIDFGVIKGYFKKEWDHKFYVPTKDYPFWKQQMEGILKPYVKNNLKPVEFTTVEGMMDQIHAELAVLIEDNTNLNIEDVVVVFSLYEGPGQGTTLP